MLRLKGITKIYDVADEKVTALAGVDIEFRESEFVSILGPSGCGKTTLLNIIGGLDKYTEGELEIGGVSTKEYGDRDWDSYRNHSIGFVFQNYNLIDHLNVLDNVMLSLTLVGEASEKRTQRALDALNLVGLRNKAYKKPNQLSGGQMQRVAIARAIVNDPDIILADEPTGALDSETSVQIMRILKDISRTRLVIMVTHNAELAREYSTRIVRLFDGKIVGDTDPYVTPAPNENIIETTQGTAFAPCALRYKNGVLSPDFSAPTEEELSSAAKAYIETVGGMKTAVLTKGGLKIVLPYTPDLKRRVKCDFCEKKALSPAQRAEAERAFNPQKELDRSDRYRNKPAMKASTAFKLSFTNLLTKRFRTVLTAVAGSIGILGISLVIALYSGLNGFIARQEAALASNPISITRESNDYDEIVNAVVSSLDGLDGKYEKDKVYIYKLVSRMIRNKKNSNIFDNEMIEQIRSVGGDDVYDIYENYNFNFNAVKEIKRGTKIFDSFYINAQYYMAINTNSFWTQLPNREMVLEQYEVIAGEYPDEADELCLILDGRNQISDINLFFNGLDFEHVSLNYTEDDLTGTEPLSVSEFVGQTYYVVDNNEYYKADATKKETNSPTGSGGVIIKTINDEITRRMGNSGGSYKISIYTGDEETGNYKYNDMFSSAKTIPLKISGVIKLKENVSVGVLGASAIGYTPLLTDKIIDNAFESKVVKDKLAELKNATDLAKSDALRPYCWAEIPMSISIYCRGFDEKEAVKSRLDAISAERKADEKSEIVYSDLMSVVLSIVKQFINIITCALLSLTAISLLVSALMIGIITYVSVLERTKEIGVLRALGARKLDISRIFNAETIMIGTLSGVLGVIITYILSWPLGALMAKFTGIGGLVALPWYFALMLIVLSALLTFVSGLIPATFAKKKDPVKALRSE